jgi:glutamate-5-semialdehyde dehydrogenase
MSDLASQALALAEAARRASRTLVDLTGRQRDDALRAMARHLRSATPAILAANTQDVAAAQAANLAAPLIERLKLDEKKVEKMAVAIEQIAQQTDPVGQAIEAANRPNGLRIEKRRVPIGVVLFLYESRPNVTTDAAALCLKSGNAVILRGGKETLASNAALNAAIQAALRELEIDPAAVQVVQSADRGLVPELLKLDQHIDIVIPRGGESLIRAVVEASRIPVLKHFTGNCHLYVDKDIDGMDRQIVDVCVNAKTSYPGGAVCNAVEHILIHRDVLARVAKPICEALASKGVEIRADDAVRSAWPAAKPATDADWGEEYLSFVVGLKAVDSIDAAIEHINRFGSHHTDGILTTSMKAAKTFARRVDSASIVVNASTRFADGGEYGLGAEIGISTDKLHARGPMGAANLTTYKWIVVGDGHCR